MYPSTVYESGIPYPPLQQRIYAYTSWRLILWSLGLQVVLLIGFGVYLDSPILFFAAFWISIGFVSYFSFRRWVRYFISQIRIDKAQNTCEIQYFDYDSPQMLRLPLSQVAFKIERIQARGPAMYNLCVYEGNKSLLYQKCGIGYWSKENCEALVHTLS